MPTSTRASSHDGRYGVTSTGATPRLLAIMGSGETSPTMVKTHRALLERLGPPPVPAVLLDTPFGFQMNADDISARAVAYFRDSVGQEMEVTSFRGGDAAAIDVERAASRVRDARYVFAGPGSPSYALRHWAGSPIPAALEDKLTAGGCVTFASAAALTLGAFTVPVYEIYKVGEAPRWLPGLDLMSAAGMHAAVIPHYDNAEGGNHDTRYCYLGEQRLQVLEADLPEDAFVLGVDEHTGLVLDLDAGSATVVGRGTVTVRKAGRSVRFDVGSEVAIRDLPELASGGGAAGTAVSPAPAASPARSGPASGRSGSGPGGGGSPLLESVAQAEEAFRTAVDGRDMRGAVEAILDLDQELVAWAADTLQSDEMDRARSALRSMIVRLGEVAEVGARDPNEVVGPFVEAILEARRDARDQQRWAAADALRDRLAALDVEVHDAPSGTTWNLRQ